MSSAGASPAFYRFILHPQLSRSWVGLGRSEAQIETGTTVVPLEVLQRAAELIQRRKQVSELELCEKLNELGALHSALAKLGNNERERDGAVKAYERVLRGTRRSPLASLLTSVCVHMRLPTPPLWQFSSGASPRRRVRVTR